MQAWRGANDRGITGRLSFGSQWKRRGKGWGLSRREVCIYLGVSVMLVFDRSHDMQLLALLEGELEVPLGQKFPFIHPFIHPSRTRSENIM